MIVDIKNISPSVYMRRIHLVKNDKPTCEAQ